MRSDPDSAAARTDRIPVHGATEGALDGLGLPPPVAEQWSRYREPQRRFILAARTGAGLAGAAIVAGRTLASYLKIGGIWVSDQTDDPRQVELALISEAEQLAWELGAIAVKREIRRGTPSRASSLPGYVDVVPPLIAAPIPDPAPPVPAGQFKWRAPSGRAVVPYMRQTTEFTCGAAALSMILARAGLIEGPDRTIELGLWRQATTVLACDPYGLAVVAARQGLRPGAVTVSTQRALFTEHLPTEQDRDLRRFIQGDFRRLAEQAGIDTQLREFEMSELAGVVASGGLAMVLVDELLVHGEACPHWILVHGLEDGHFIAHDPWSETGQGESWVDAYDVPLSAAALDQIAWTGDPRYRAMLTFTI